jgi:ABC-type maltose transport system permease subunit
MALRPFHLLADRDAACAPGHRRDRSPRFTRAWNEFFLALVFMQDKEMFTLLFDALSISMLPMVIVYLLMQRQFIAGLAGGAMK